MMGLDVFRSASHLDFSGSRLLPLPSGDVNRAVLDVRDLGVVEVVAPLVGVEGLDAARVVRVHLADQTNELMHRLGRELVIALGARRRAAADAGTDQLLGAPTM
jgi:hypothetical protein